MKVFLSWSGERSRAVATALREWLPDVLQNVQPWMSASDIDAGARWNREIDQQLAATNFGIICLTRENTLAPWLLFEAGAIAKTISGSYVCPYLLDIEPTQVPPGPLSQFQAKRATEDETRQLLQSLNTAAAEKGLSAEALGRAFDRWWPDLEKRLVSIAPSSAPPSPPRPVDEMTAELLTLVRGLSRTMSMTYEQIATTRTLEHFEYLLEELPARDAKVLRLMLGFDGGRIHTAEEVSAMMGLTPSATKRIRRTALHRIEKALDDLNLAV